MILDSPPVFGKTAKTMKAPTDHQPRLTRRGFHKAAGSAAASTFAFQVVPSTVWGANERPTLGGIGTGGKGESDIRNSANSGFEVIGLCDVVDAKRVPELTGRPAVKRIFDQRERFPDAKFYTDWREMMADLGDKLDAITVSTPDHHHAHASIAAMKAGKHVYCQKPLTHGIWEARMMAEVAKQTGVKTQMGNQAHANDGMRRAVELIRAGMIGQVKEVHAWTNRPIWPQGFSSAPPAEPVPEWLDWEQWVGPAPFVDYSFRITPFNWRGWWHYGTGALGDMACHIMDMAYWALGLDAPVAVKGEENGGTELSAPINSIITYEFAPNEYTVPEGVTYTWYDGYVGATFDPQRWALVKKTNEYNHPDNRVLQGLDFNKYGSVVVGTRGSLIYNRNNENWVVMPSSGLDGFTDWPAPSIPRARGQNPHHEWFDAVTGKIDQPESNFGLAGPFTETVLLGCLAQRVPNERLEWDAAKMEVRGRPELKPYIQREYRPGWELKV